VGAQAEGRVQWPAANWVDLFFDLAFAAGIIAITGSYAYNHTVVGGIWFLTVYAVLGCAWVLTNASTAAFTTRLRIFTTGTVVLLVSQMGVVLLLSVAADETEFDRAGLFVVLLAALLCGCLALALRSKRFDVHLPSAVPKLVGVSVIMLISSLVLPPAADVVVWVIAIVALAAAIVPAVRDPEVELTGLTHRLWRADPDHRGRDSGQTCLENRRRLGVVGSGDRIGHGLRDTHHDVVGLLHRARHREAA